MFSLRALARSVPRTVSRSIATSSRSALSRPVSAVPNNTFLQSSLKQATKSSCAAFSTTQTFKQSAADGMLTLACVMITGLIVTSCLPMI